MTLRIRKFLTANLKFWPVLAAAFLFCSPEEQGPAASAGPGGAPVQVTHPGRRDLTEFIDLNATTLFLNKEIVRATFQGFIEKINKNFGDQVKRGDLLLQIRTKESAAMDSLHVITAGIPFQGSISIYARFDGILTALHFNTGDYVAEGEEIAVISNPASLRIVLNVPYQYVSLINRQGPCEILLPDGNRVSAVIRKVIPNVDPVAQTQALLLQLNHAKLLPENLNVGARLAVKTAKQAIVAPQSAVMCDETMQIFWIMQVLNDSTAVRINIRKGIETDSLVQVLEPALSPQDVIICDGAYGLPDTAHILISGQIHE